MKLRIARKICRYMGYGYPIDNIQRLKTAVYIWEKAQKRFKHFKRENHMITTKPMSCGNTLEFEDCVMVRKSWYDKNK